ncbi:DUF1801 domain-containing protein [Chitinimonas viridis]|uniref:DUF1801 domain-containing protein n=1 Tax=Chitinimonas viridis TaxID=664880 RepID=A0ABT8B0S1_9NEIS|nr:DUF1801 domain-containing protein [Chitinimonas viridis]MDN3575828.1 DUF1801 domain-containing protein [Chitinimonas viridis]
MSTDRVAKLLDDIRALDEARYTLVQTLREAVLSLGVGVTEEVKYGGLLFSAGKPFCGVFSYAKHVSLEFGDGAALPDPHQVLEGEGKLRRHIKLSAIQDIQAKQVHTYLGLAYQAAAPA